MNSLASFHTIHIYTRCKISLHQDNSCAIHVDEPDDVAKWIDYHVKNGKLIIKTKPMYYGFLLLSHNYLKIRITCNKLLKGIQLFDRAFVPSTEELQLEKLGIILYQDGVIDLELNAWRADCTILKEGNIKLKGYTIETFVHIHRNGFYNGAELNASEGLVYLNDNSSASVWINEEIEARILGRSNFSYRGVPRLSWLSVDEGSRVEPLQEPEIEKLAL